MNDDLLRINFKMPW